MLVTFLYQSAAYHWEVIKTKSKQKLHAAFKIKVSTLCLDFNGQLKTSHYCKLKCVFKNLYSRFYFKGPLCYI